MRKNGSKAVVLLSGGMDSCVAAAIAAERYQLAMVHVGYGQRTEGRERRAFDDVCDFYGVNLRLATRLDHFRQIGGSALLDRSIPVPETGPGPEIPVTYVPFRNAHFLAVAVSWAEVIGATAVVIGAVAEDSSGYPDCRPEYYRAFAEVVRQGTRPGSGIEIHTPVIGMSKEEIVRKGMELGAPLAKTWSCYQYEDEACGVCDSCVLRLRAFARAGLVDPIPYRAGVAL
ncbi:MAG TPA: 7-cyano-7-deazaguanine synthase QueC [Candidatus Dormibacteraeota bacterium]|nr:7-cyano-7-deazaguanine synthase QueC [Candidatus Dormibacteraeota bacterium]